MKFDFVCTPTEDHLGQYFYESFKLSIKLWLNKEGWEKLARDESVRKPTKTKSKAKIQKDRNLDQQCPRGKRLLKLIKGNHDEQPKKAQKANPPFIETSLR